MEEKMTTIGTVSLAHDTSICVQNKEGDENWQALDECRKLMKRLGFSFHQDPGTKKRYPTLAKLHHHGERNGLQFHSNIYPMGMKIEFYQDINTVNQSGGRYDFDKLEKMPYLMALKFKSVASQLIETLQGCGYENTTKPEPKNAHEFIRQHRREEWHHETDDLIGPDTDDYNRKDKDGALLSDGMIRWFRDTKGRLVRGTVYHNINNMWWVDINARRPRNIACFNLFTYEPSMARKSFPRDKSIGKMQTVMKKATETQNFEKAIQLRDAIIRRKSA